MRPGSAIETLPTAVGIIAVWSRRCMTCGSASRWKGTLMLVPQPRSCRFSAGRFILTDESTVEGPAEVVALVRELLGPPTGFAFPKVASGVRAVAATTADLGLRWVRPAVGRVGRTPCVCCGRAAVSVARCDDRPRPVAQAHLVVVPGGGPGRHAPAQRRTPSSHRRPGLAVRGQAVSTPHRGRVRAAWVAEALAAGHRVVASPHTSMYLNYPATDAPGEPLSIADGNSSEVVPISVESMYGYRPVPRPIG
jgi:hypothetical protein